MYTGKLSPQLHSDCAVGLLIWSLLTHGAVSGPIPSPSPGEPEAASHHASTTLSQLPLQISEPTGSPHSESRRESVPERSDWSEKCLETKPPFSFPSDHYHDCGISKYLAVSVPLLDSMVAMLIYFQHNTLWKSSLTVWSVGLAYPVRLQFHWRCITAFTCLPKYMHSALISRPLQILSKIKPLFFSSSCLVVSSFLSLQIKFSHGEIHSAG